MTIEEKAKEIFQVQECMECENASDEMWMKRDAFERGAEWMLENTARWISKCAYEAQDCNYVKENGDHDVDLLLNNLRKALEK